MPIHDLGYRSWRGVLHGAPGRTLAITGTGCRLALKSTWVKRTLFFAWMPILFWGAGLFFGEQTLQENRGRVFQNQAGGEIEQLMDQAVDEFGDDLEREILIRQLRSFPGAEVLADSLDSNDPDEMRRVVWRWLLMTFFRYPQAVAMVFLLGFVVPGLISRDFRSRAFLLYFSRPIGRLEYVLGKLAIPAVFLVFMSTLPALALYLTGLFLSPDLSVVWLTWDIPFRIVLATLVLVLPTASLAIALSSLTQESRFASFAWFGVWVLGHGAWLAVAVSRAISISQTESDFDGSLSELMRQGGMSGWSPLSLYVSLGEVQSWVFGFGNISQTWPSLVMLVFVTAGSLAVFWRRIGSSIQS